MPLKPKQVRLLTGVGLALVTLLTRIPFMARTYFEFDSIDFAVATYRFSLEQVTPHMPGYIGHVLLGRFFTSFTSDINQAFVWLSTTLSILSVLFIWRAGAQLRGERVGLIAAVLWLFTPLFWFYGAVATAYIHEALFATAVLYLCMKLLRHPANNWILPLLAITLSLSGSMRQNSVLFFLPVIIFVAWKTRQSFASIGLSVLLFAAVTLAWVMILFSESGGSEIYMFYAGRETIFKSQSILFGNTIGVHAAVIAKLLFYLVVASLPMLAIAAWYSMSARSELIASLKAAMRSNAFWILVLTALPAFLFYLLVYFMKAGYLLNVLPSIVLLGAVLVDQLAIAHAKRVKLREENRFALTRKIITKRAIIVAASISFAQILWFTLPLPGKDYKLFVDGFTAVSFGNDLSDRISAGSSFDRLLNRAFAYTSAQGITMIHSINQRTMSVMKAGGPKTIIDTWWSRWNYIYSPEYPVYDVITFPDRLQMGLSRQNDRVPIVSKTIDLDLSQRTLLLIRPDHPDLDTLRSQATLTALDAELGIYNLTPRNSSITWKGQTFRFGER